MVMFHQRRGTGFTIVELLITIVVIGILAAIVVVAYTGAQARAQNAQTSTAVEYALKLLMLYQADNNAFPVPDGTGYCLTIDNQCTAYDGTQSGIRASNTPLVTALAPYGRLPTTVPPGTKYYGMSYKYLVGFTLDNVSSPLMIMFWLKGSDQDCQAASGTLVSVTDSPPLNNFTASRNAKAVSGDGQTRCYMMLRS